MKRATNKRLQYKLKRLQSTIEGTSIMEQEDKFKKINVPDDGSCLFWAVTMSFLLPVRNNHSLFSERFIEAFGEFDRTDIARVRQLFVDITTFENIYEDEILTELVTKIFRGRVVDEMRKNKNKLFKRITSYNFLCLRNKEFILNGNLVEKVRSAFPSQIHLLDLNKLKPDKLNISSIEILNEELDKVSNYKNVQKVKFDLYLDAMRDSRSWAGEHEIRAIQMMLNCHVEVYEDPNPMHIINMTSKNILLFNNNDNRYKFGLIRAEFVMENLKNKNYLLASKYIDLGVDKINYQDINGDSLLHFAVGDRDGDSIINRLVWQGADLNIRNNKNQTPSDLAIKVNRETSSYFKILRFCGSENRFLKSLKEQKYENYETKNGVSYNKNGQTKLHLAAALGDERIVQHLLATSSSELPMIPTDDNKRHTALHLAVINNHLNVVDCLLANGADVNAKDFNINIKNSTEFSHMSPLHYASAKGYLEITKALIEKSKAEIDIEDNNGNTPLQAAVKFGHLKIVKYLVEKDADINSTDKTLTSVLSYAARAGHAPIVHYLVEKGAELNSVDQQGMTPLHHAVKCQRWNVVYCLVEHKADVNVTDSNHETPLVKAVNAGKWQIVKCLLQHGALLRGVSDIRKESLFKHFIFERDPEQRFYRAIHLGNVEMLEKLLEKNNNKSDEMLAKAYEKIKFFNNLHLNQQMCCFVETKLLSVRFFSNRKEKSNTKEVNNLDNLKTRIKLVLDLIDRIISIEDDDNVSFIYFGKLIASHLHILKRQLSWTYDILPWKEMQFCLGTSILNYTIPTKSEITTELLTHKRRLVSHLSLFKNKLVGLELNLTEENINTKKKIAREQALENILKKDPEFVELYKDFEILKDVYSLQKIEKHLLIACSVDLKVKPVIGQLVIERALQVIGECMKNTTDSPNLSDNTQMNLINNAPLNTINSFTYLRNLLSHVQTLTKKAEIEESDPNFYSNIQDDLKKLQMEVALIIDDKKNEAVNIFIKQITECKNIDEVRRITRGLLLGRKMNSLASIKLHNNFDKIKVLIKELDVLIGTKTDSQKECFHDFYESIENYELKVENSQNENYFPQEQIYQFISNIDTCNNIDAIKRKAFLIFNWRVNNVESNVLYETISDSVRQLHKSVESQTPKLDYYVEISFVISKLITVTDFGCRRIDHIDWFKFNFEKENTEIIKDIINTKIVNKIDTKLSLFIDKLPDEDKQELFRKEYKNKKEMKTRKKALVDFYDRYCTNNKNKIIDLDHFSELCKLINFKLVKKETFQTLYEETDDTKCKNIVQRLNRTNDSYVKLLKVLNADPMNGFTQDAFIDFIKSFETAKSLDKHFIQNHKHLFFESEDYFKKLKMLDDIFNGTKNDVDRVNLLIRNDDVRVAVEMLMLTLTEILDNLSLLETNRLFLDEPSPVLIGKNLRNYLAHGDFVIDLLSIDHLKSMVYHYNILKRNLNKAKSLVYTNTFLVGKVTADDISKVVADSSSKLDLLSQYYSFIAVDKCDTNFFKTFINYPLDFISKSIGSTQLNFDNVLFFNRLLNNNLNIYQKDASGNSIIYYLPKLGSKNILKFLIRNNYIDVNTTSFYGNTLLHLAADSNQNETAELLIANGADVHACNDDGLMPIHFATMSGHAKVISTLVKAGANINTYSKNNKTLLHYAANSGQRDVTKYLLDNGSNVHSVDIYKYAPLHEACKAGDISIARLLLEHEADVNAITKDGHSPLHIAALKDHDQLVELLLANGADINAVANDGATVLQMASFNSSGKVVNILVNNGADIEANGSAKLTALQSASTVGNNCAIEALLEKGAKVDGQSCGITALHMAAANNHEETVQMLINFKANVNVKNRNGETALHRAAEKGSVDIIEILIAFNANVNEVDEDGRSPLHYAVRYNQTKAVELLIKNGAATDVSDDAGHTPLFLSCFNGNLKIFEKLKTDVAIIRKDKRGRTPLHVATEEGRAKIVKKLLESSVQVDGETNDGTTALHMAARNGHIDIINTLLKNNSSIDKVNKNNMAALHIVSCMGHHKIAELLLNNNAAIDSLSHEDCTALHWATYNGNVDTVRILLKYKANTEHINAEGLSALHVAVVYDHIEIAEMLCDAGANVNICTITKDTPLHYAAEYNKIDFANILIEKGANANAIDISGDTPLHLAAIKGHFHMVKLLVEAGANVNSLSDKDVTPLHMATLNSHSDIVKLLLINRADIDAKTEGYSALHLAVNQGHAESVEILLDFNANVNVKDDRERSPLDIAARLGHFYLAELLIRHGADVFARNNHNSVLHTAVTNVNVLRLVLTEIRNKCDGDADRLRLVLNAHDTEGDTPLMWTAESGYYDSIKLLLDCDEIDINKQNSNGWSALHWAAHEGHQDIVNVLMEKMADVNIKDKNSETAFDLASRKMSEDEKYETIAAVLLSVTTNI